MHTNQVIVDAESGFKMPSKPIGPFILNSKQKKQKTGFEMVEDPAEVIVGLFHRCTHSRVERMSMRFTRVVVVAVGGGGILYHKCKRRFSGHGRSRKFAALLAYEIGADKLLICGS